MNSKLFETNQEYLDSYKDIQIPYSDVYYSVHMENYLKSNIPNEFVLINYFTKLYCWTCGTEYAIKNAIKHINKFSHIKITKELFKKIMNNVYGSRKTKPDYNDLELWYIALSVLEKLLSVCKFDLNLMDLFESINPINLSILSTIPNYKQAKKNLIPLIKKIFTLVFDSNPESLTPETFEFVCKYKLIDNLPIQNQIQYKLTYRYETSIKKLKSYKNFIPDIKCLENACEIKNNLVVITNLLKTIEPNQKCLSNALAHIDNQVIYLLVEKINPTKEQIINYCELKNDLMMRLLVERL